MPESVEVQLENTELHPSIRRADNYIWNNINCVQNFLKNRDWCVKITIIFVFYQKIMTLLEDWFIN